MEDVMEDVMGNMMGYGSGAMFLMTIFWLAIFILIMLGIIYLIRNMRDKREETKVGRETPLEILKRRYVEGEIDKKEFEEKKQGIG